jgi:hypothetical protein
MTRRGVFSTLAGTIAGLFGPARSWGWRSPEVALTPGPYKTINSAYTGLGEYPKTATEAIMMAKPYRAVEHRTYIIYSSDICAGEYPNVKSWEEKFTTYNPEVIQFLDSFLMKVYPNKEANWFWKKSVRIEYAPGQNVEDEAKLNPYLSEEYKKELELWTKNWDGSKDYLNAL